MSEALPTCKLCGEAIRLVGPAWPKKPRIRPRDGYCAQCADKISPWHRARIDKLVARLDDYRTAVSRITDERVEWHRLIDAEQDATADALRRADLAETEAARLIAKYESGPTHREALGRRVRDIWISWAHEQPTPKSHWLTSWDDLDESSKEVDRRIGEGIAGMRAEAEQTQRITCGASSPDSDTERIFQQLRENEGHRVGAFGGCGKAILWTYSYRCVECSRFFHRECILKHFDESEREAVDANQNGDTGLIGMA